MRNISRRRSAVLCTYKVGGRNKITRYPMWSFMKSAEKRQSTIAYSGMMLGEEPPYRP